MSEGLKKISVSVVLAVCELLLGITLLSNPAGLASAVIIVAGVILFIGGAWDLFQYIRLPREEAAKTWKLAEGAGLLAAGLIAICNQHWLVQILGTLTTLYAFVVLASTFMKLQMAVDALRGGRPFWYLMAISTAVALGLFAFLFFHPFQENILWPVSGVVLILLAVLDGVYFWKGRSE
ncbi:MAG: DUF308 domain-containing protein [Clostridia bacterium]|nr:DUF308 domain-containing protein [Clostridia bacterium]